MFFSFSLPDRTKLFYLYPDELSTLARRRTKSITRIWRTRQHATLFFQFCFLLRVLPCKQAVSFFCLKLHQIGIANVAQQEPQVLYLVGCHMLYFAASSWLRALSFDPRPTLPTSIAIEDFKRQLRGELDALQAWKWSRGAGHQTSLSYCVGMLKRCDAQFSRFFIDSSKALHADVLWFLSLWVMIVFLSKLVMMISCLQWFLRSLTVLSFGRKCMKRLPFFGNVGRKLPDMNFDYLLPMWTCRFVSFCPCFFCGACCWDARLYQSFVKTLKVGFLARWLSET